MPSGWISSETILYVEIFRFQASTEDLSRMSQPMTWNASPWRQRNTESTGLQGHLDLLAMLSFPLCLILISHLSRSALEEANIGSSRSRNKNIYQRWRWQCWCLPTYTEDGSCPSLCRCCRAKWEGTWGYDASWRLYVGLRGLWAGILVSFQNTAESGGIDWS